MLSGCGETWPSHVLPGLGRVSVPSRLEGPWQQVRTEKIARFQFGRSYPWYRIDAIGSGTPWREELFIEIRNSAEQQGRGCTGQAAREVKPLDWKPLSWEDESAGIKEKELVWLRDGRFQTAEGVYTMNARRDRVVLVLLDVPEKAAQICYRVWRSDSTLPKAKGLVEAVEKSLEITDPLK